MTNKGFLMKSFNLVLIGLLASSSFTFSTQNISVPVAAAAAATAAVVGLGVSWSTPSKKEKEVRDAKEMAEHDRIQFGGILLALKEGRMTPEEYKKAQAEILKRIGFRK